MLLTREWYMHPNGQLPAYEWNFGDANPPVHAWAAIRVYQIEHEDDGARRSALSRAHLPEAAAQLHLVGQPQGRAGQQPVRGRLLGLDNIGAFDRSNGLPRRRPLEQWTARRGWRCTASTCSRSRSSWRGTTGLRGRGDEVLRALRHIGEAMNQPSAAAPTASGTRRWAGTSTCCACPDGSRRPVSAITIAGLVPVLAVAVADPRPEGLPRTCESRRVVHRALA